MPAHPCPFPGCRALSPRAGRCEAHRPSYDQPNRIDQHGRTWRKIRDRHIREEPSCRACGALATEVDHILELADGGTHERSNLRSLCSACHLTKTGQARHERAARRR